MRTPHTGTNRGKKVRVVLRDGTKIDDKFVDRTNKWVVLEKTGRVMKSDIRSFFVLKGEEKEGPPAP